MMSVSELRLRHLVEEKKRHARRLQKLKADPHRLLITVLIGNNLANIGAASLATSLSFTIFQRLHFSDAATYGVGITTGVMTLLILIFGEITPKAYCIDNAEKVSLRIVPVLLLFRWIFTPLAWALSLFTRITSGGYLDKRYPLVTEDEVRTIVKIGEEEGVIDHEEKKMIHNVFEMDNTEVSSVMTPRVDMVAFESTLTVNEAIDKIKDKVYSRLPVFEDNIDKIIGIAYAKDILHEGLSGKGDKLLKDVVQPANFVPENMMINILLRQFRKQKSHIAVVIDEHGGVAGLVTIEDVLEELVGEIYDETDKPEKLVTLIDECTYKVMAKINIGDLNDMTGFDLKEDESYDTLSGFILHELGEIPEEGTVIRVDNISMTVGRVEKHRIIEVFMKKEPPEAAADVGGSESGSAG